MRCGFLYEMCCLNRDCGAWLSEDVWSHMRCGGSLEMWWLSGDVVAQWRCGGSVEIVVAHWR